MTLAFNGLVIMSEIKKTSPKITIEAIAVAISTLVLIEDISAATSPT
jgi:hypothetical protein